MRPRLVPTAQRSWRGSTTLQFGREPGRAVVLSGITRQMAAFLDGLDGTRTATELDSWARRHRLSPKAAGHLVGLLAAAGLVEDASLGCPELGRLPLAERDRLTVELAALAAGRPDAAGVLARRLAGSVGISTAGPVGAALAALLAASGVGRLTVHDPRPVGAADLGPLGYQPEDLGRPRSEALAGRLARTAGSTRLSAGDDRPDTITVVVADRGAGNPAGALLAAGQPHLHLAAGEGGWRVGPTVLPGRTACGNCLDLFRADRDPHWPLLAARPAAGGSTAVDLALGVALAAREVLGFLQGDQVASVGGTIEFTGPDWRLRRRSWAAHPRCPCGAAAG